MKEFKNTKKIYILPIVFIFLFICSIIFMIIYLHNNKISTILWGISVPVVLMILTIIYLIKLINAPNTDLKIDKDNIYVMSHPIKLKDIVSINTKTDIFINTKIVILTKQNEIYNIYHIKNPHDVLREIKIKYLKRR